MQRADGLFPATLPRPGLGSRPFGAKTQQKWRLSQGPRAVESHAMRLTSGCTSVPSMAAMLYCFSVRSTHPQ